MTDRYDLAIRGGTVVDGTGRPGVTADVAIRDGRIVGIGSCPGSTAQVLDADGALVTPGFIDTHSHYDGQVVWDSRVWPSSLHGTTTIVNGNCGVGFAPVLPQHRDFMIELMESIEEIPAATLREGLAWRWQQMSEFLDVLPSHDVDVAFMVAHNALRLYVMGERGLDEAATDEDVKAMGDAMQLAIAGGALGFSTSRARTHRTNSGDPVPSRYASIDELVGIARAMGPGAMFQIAPGGHDEESQRHELEIQERVAATGVSLVVPVVAGGDGVTVAVDSWRARMDELDVITGNGDVVWAQVAPRPVGVFLGCQATMTPFSGIAAYDEIGALAAPERARAMREPARRAAILDGVGKPRQSGRGFQGVLRVEAFEQMWELTDPPMYEPHPDDSIRARAAALGVPPAELAYDLVSRGSGDGLIYFAFFGYAGFSLDNTAELMRHPRAIVGLGDGGAHVGSVCDASYPTTMLAYWGRDRTRGERFDVPWIVNSLSARPAEAFRLHDRGVLAPGMRADVNVIDFDNLRMRMPEAVYDLPGNNRRLNQGADGYLATLVAGEVTYENGQPTGALPGRPVRPDPVSRARPG